MSLPFSNQGLKDDYQSLIDLIIQLPESILEDKQAVYDKLTKTLENIKVYKRVAASTADYAYKPLSGEDECYFKIALQDTPPLIEAIWESREDEHPTYLSETDYQKTKKQVLDLKANAFYPSVFRHVPDNVIFPLRKEIRDTLQNALKQHVYHNSEGGSFSEELEQRIVSLKKTANKLARKSGGLEDIEDTFKRIHRLIGISLDRDNGIGESRTP